MHKDELLHFVSLIKSPNIELNGEDSFVLGKMAMLMLARSKENLPDFATKAMEIFKTHSRFQSLRRICLGKRHGLANQISIKSCEHLPSADNSMRTGYNCFIDPNGSLLSMKPSEIRCYANAKKVVESYKTKAKPPQRSIQRIALLGLKSGICLPLSQSNRNIGLVFMNSSEEDLAKLENSDYCMLTYFEAVSTIALLSDGLPSEEYYRLAEFNKSKYIGSILSEKVMEQTLMAHLHYLKIPLPKLHIKVEAAPSLVSHGNFANVISRLNMFRHAHEIKIEVIEKNKQLEWHVEYIGAQNLSAQSLLIKPIFDDCEALEMQLVKQDRGMILTVDHERVDQEANIFYSIEQEH